MRKAKAMSLNEGQLLDHMSPDDRPLLHYMWGELALCGTPLAADELGARRLAATTCLDCRKALIQAGHDDSGPPSGVPPERVTAAN